MQVRKCENLIAFFTNQIKSLTAELKNEKLWRAHQLTKIVKALLYFEAKLKNDQKTIRRQLYEKDSEINRLAQEILVLREQCGERIDAPPPIQVNEVAQYCPACRKQYYQIDVRNVKVQAHVRYVNTDTSPTQSFDGLSSSEDGVPSFAEARRSKKYMSKRTSGTFRDYLRSRSNESQECGLLATTVATVANDILTTDFNSQTYGNIEEATENIILLPDDRGCDNNNDDDGDVNDSNKVVDDVANKNNDCVVVYNNDDDIVAKENGKREITNNRRNQLKHGRTSSMRSIGSNATTYSNLINNMHGLRTRCSDDDVKEEEPISSSETSDSNSNQLAFGGIGSGKCFNSSSTSFLKKYELEDVAKSQFESNDDWYASASDMDDSDNVLSKTYGQNIVNPVLECVNQILLQQSIDGIIDSPPSPETNVEIVHKEPSTNTGRQKRVHFSTQNSMVHVPRAEFLFQAPLTPDDPIEKEQPFSYESVYTNEYEPIGSENNSSSHYVEMEAKCGADERLICITPRPKIPPALPPKPANLMKLRQALKISQASKYPSLSSSPLSSSSSTSPSTSPILKIPSTTIECAESVSEPDYCSIAEVAEVIKKIQIVADVHKNADEMSTVSEDARTDVTDETFADVPKLPNVAAIISPKKEFVSKFIAQDNYITKSPNKTTPASTPTQNDEREMCRILAEINASKKVMIPSSKLIKTPLSPSSPSSPLPPVVIQCPRANSAATAAAVTTQSTLAKVVEEPMQSIHAEFDWYNLDVEYGKLNPPDVIKETVGSATASNAGVGRVDEMIISEENGVDDDDVGVEYNLEKEFTLTASPDIIRKAVNEYPTAADHSNGCGGGMVVNNGTTVDFGCGGLVGVDTPITKKNFDAFLDDTGLIAKPLPRKRKIYYSAPFV